MKKLRTMVTINPFLVLGVILLAWSYVGGVESKKITYNNIDSTKNGEKITYTDESTGSSGVIAYYFHGTKRCIYCRKIENQSRDIIETNFKKEIAEKKLQFKSVNIEEPENQHYIKDYKLYTKSLVLCIQKDGKELKWKNLPDIWLYALDSIKFYNYVSEEVKKSLKESQ